MKLDFDKILKLLGEGENFSYSRFGDGEFNCMLGKSGSNGDGHGYHRSLGEALIEVLCGRPEYYLGTREFAWREGVSGRRYENLLNKIALWETSEIFPEANVSGRMGEFFTSLEGKRVVLIANGNIVKIKKFKHENVIVSYLDCWLNYELVRSRIDQIIRKNDILLYCAGMMSCVLIDYFYREWGKGITQIDMGSALDIWVGIRSRGYMKKLDIGE